MLDDPRVASESAERELAVEGGLEIGAVRE